MKTQTKFNQPLRILTKEKQRGLKATESERNLELRWLTAQEHKMLRRTSGKGSSF